MWLGDDFKEQIRSSVSILDVVGGYVALKKRGVNHIGLCPFHNEKTPSFNVNESLQIFKCFGCGEGGDVFTFISRIEGLEFREAVEWLAQRAGIPIPRGEGAQKEASQRRALLELMKWADESFQRNLGQSPESQEYLHNRGIKEKMVSDFGLGFAPPGNRLLRQLDSSGFSRQDALACGLIKEGEAGQVYDNFRNRLIFPIRDLTGSTLAFGGRILGEGIPKYLNSPDTPLYKKSKNLYGLWLGRGEIRRREFAILVEGYFDCIVPHQFGFGNVIASLGTSLTQEQARMIRRYSSRIIINYDGDEAGIAATLRAIETLLREDFEINVLQLPSDVDPDTFLREEGPEQYAELLKNSQRALDFAFNQLLSRQSDLRSPRGKREVVDGILPFLQAIPDKIERSVHVSRIASRIDLEPELLIQEMRRSVRRTRAQRTPARRTLLMQPTPSELNLLAAAVDPVRQEFLDEVDFELLEGLVTEPIFVEIQELRKRNRDISILYLRDRLDDPALRDMLESVAVRSGDFAVSQDEFRASLQALRKKQIERRIQRIQEQIQSAESKGGSFEELAELLARMADLRRRLELEL